MKDKEYIEREALRNELLKISIYTDDLYGMGILEGLDRATRRVNNAPAADVVEVCRCKNCKHYQPVTPTCGNCFRTTFIQHPDDFCSRGERKEATP